MFVSKLIRVAMIRSVLRMCWFVAFRELVLMQWSTMVSALNQTSARFTVYGVGQTPIAGMQLMAKVTVCSLLECGRLCWNNGGNAGCEGFLYQPQSCNEKPQSSCQHAGCQLLKFSNVIFLTFQTAKISCPAQFYVSSTATSQVMFPSIMGNISGTVPVRGLTAYYGRLYVTRQAQASNQVSVYNTTTLQLERIITVVGAIGTHYGLAVSSNNKYLYIADYDQSRVFKVNLSSPSTVASWAVASMPRALSLNGLQNILVAGDSYKVQEFAPNGSLVREVTTNSKMWHAVEVRENTWAVSQQSAQQVSVMTANGTVLYNSGNTGISFNPYCLGVDKQGYVFVADSRNNGVLVFNPNLAVAQPLRLTATATVVIGQPMALWLDPSNGYLFVGEWASPYRVVVFDVSHISTLFNTP